MRQLGLLLCWQARPYFARRAPGQPIAGRAELPAPHGAPPVASPVGVPPRSLRSNFVAALVANVTYMACQWGMLVVLAKIGTPEMVGQFALGFAVTAPVFLFANLNLRAVQATDARGEYAFGDYLGLRLVAVTMALAAVTAIVLLGGYPAGTALVILAVGVAKTFESVSDVFGGLSQLQERMDRVATSVLLKGPLSLAALTLGVWATGSVLWGTVALASVWLLVLVGYDAPGPAMLARVWRRPRVAGGAGAGALSLLAPRWNAATLWRLAWFALPLGVASGLVSLTANTPRYAIQQALGDRSLGLFAALAYMMTAGTAVVGALEQSASARLARHFAEHEIGAFVRLTLKLIGACVALAAAGVVFTAAFGRRVLTLIYTHEYAEHADVLTLLMVAAGFGYAASVATYALTASRCFRPQLPLWALVAGSTAVASYLLVPQQGLRGAAWALITGSAVHLAGSLALGARTLRSAAGRDATCRDPAGGSSKLDSTGGRRVSGATPNRPPQNEARDGAGVSGAHLSVVAGRAETRAPQRAGDTTAGAPRCRE